MSVPARTRCCQGQAWCPITCTSEILARKWHTIIVHELLAHGPSGFSELETRIGDISSKVLSESLDDLEAKDLLRRRVVKREPERVAYELTEAGRDLQPVIEAMRAWGREHLDPPSRGLGAGEEGGGLR